MTNELSRKIFHLYMLYYDAAIINHNAIHQFLNMYMLIVLSLNMYEHGTIKIGLIEYYIIVTILLEYFIFCDTHDWY